MGIIFPIGNHFPGNSLAFNLDSLTVEVTVESDKLVALIKFVSQFGILEMARAGALAVKRGAMADDSDK